MSYRLTRYYSQPIGAISKVINELLVLAFCAAVVCLLLMLRNLIFSGSANPPSYQVWIMTFGDDHPGHDPSALDNWPSVIEVPADFFANTQVESACEETLAAARQV